MLIPKAMKRNSLKAKLQRQCAAFPGISSNAIQDPGYAEPLTVKNITTDDSRMPCPLPHRAHSVGYQSKKPKVEEKSKWKPHQ